MQIKFNQDEKARADRLADAVAVLMEEGAKIGLKDFDRRVTGAIVALDSKLQDASWVHRGKWRTIKLLFAHGSGSTVERALLLLIEAEVKKL